MIQQAILGFLVNAAWEVVLLAVGAATLLRLVRPAPAWQCRIWSAFLLLAVLLPADLPSMLPLHGQGANETVQVNEPNASALPPPAIIAPPPTRGDAPPASDGPRLVLEPATARLLTGLYLIIVGLGTGRLLLKVARARRLRLGSRPTELPGRLEAVIHQFAVQHQMGPPAVRTSTGLSSPAVIGLRKPVILLPEGFRYYHEAEAITALLHECAHVARRDYGLNLLCELLALPLIWHPAVHLIRARISDSREMACDRVAAEQMGDRAGYARSLIALAKRAVGAEPSFAGAQPLLGRASLTCRVNAVLLAATARRSAFAQAASALLLLPAILAPPTMLHLTPAIAASHPFDAPARQSVGPSAKSVHKAAASDPLDGLEYAAAIAPGQAEPAVAVASGAPSATLPVRALPTGSAARVVQAEDAKPPVGAALRPTAGQPYSEADRQLLFYNGISAADAAAFGRMGYSNLTVSDLINLHYRGISVGFVARLRAAGFPPFSPEDLIALSVQGVSPGEIASLGRIGHATLSAADLIRIHYRGVTPRFADRLHSLGYDNLPATKLISMFDTGIVPWPSDDGPHV